MTVALQNLQIDRDLKLEWRSVHIAVHKICRLITNISHLQKFNLLATDFFFQILAHTVFKM